VEVSDRQAAREADALLAHVPLPSLDALDSERVVYPGVWNKLVVVVREDSDETILNHALIQGRRRYRR